MTTTKTQELKAKAAKEVTKAQKIEKDNKAKEVKYRNIINEKANQVEKELIAFFRPLIGKKIRTISGYGNWSRLVNGKLNCYIEDLRKEGFRVICRYSAGSLYFEIDTTYKTDSMSFSGWDHTSTNYVKADFYIGSWDEKTGNLYKVKEEENTSQRRTDWTVEELAATRKKIIQLDDELRNLKNSIWEFRR
mgnify:CR=1 FL=1